MNNIDAFSLGGSRVELSIERQDYPIIFYNDKKYHRLTNFFEEVSLLTLPAYVALTAKIVNFMVKVREFEVIQDAHSFREKYKKQISAEANKFDITNFRTSSYGIYNVEVITEPYWKDGELIFYATSESTGVPYKVAFKPANESQSPSCEYTLLPRLK